MFVAIWCFSFIHNVSFCPFPPPRAYLDVDVALSSEAFHNYVSSAMGHINHALKLIVRLFLVEDLVDSLKVSGGPDEVY